MPNPHTSANRLSEHISAAIRRTVIAAGVTRLVVACSGGADSVCLAHATARVARERGWSLTIAHIRHGMRPDDGADAALVAALAETMGTPFVLHELVFDADGPPTRNTEATLRAARYAALDAIADACGADAVLTGHTLDDQAETVLLHLLRGAGTDGLSGIVPIGPLPGGAHANGRALVRPLLTIRRAETHAYCAANALTFIHDPTNDDDRYTRNWLRLRVLPLLEERFPATSPVLARTAELVAGEADYLRQQTHAAMEASVRLHEPNLAVFDAQAVAAMHPALLRRVLREIVDGHGDELGRMESIERLRSAALSSSSAVVHVGALACCRAYDAIVMGAPTAVTQQIRMMAAHRHPLFTGEKRLRFNAPWHFPSAPGAPDYSLAIYPANDIPACGRVHMMHWLRIPDGAECHLRTRRDGDRFIPAGHTTPKTLRKYFMERDVPTPVRGEVPLLLVGDAICWVIGYDTASPFATDAATATHVAVLTANDDEHDGEPGKEGER